MAKSKKRKLFNVANVKSEAKLKAKLSEVLSGIAQLLLQGTYPATHAQILVEAIGVLETLANVERQREAEKANLEPAPEAEPEQKEELGPQGEQTDGENGV